MTGGGELRLDMSLLHSQHLGALMQFMCVFGDWVLCVLCTHQVRAMSDMSDMSDSRVA